MKRWMIIVLWFVLQFLWNFLTKTSFGADHFFIERLIVSIEYMAAPIQIIASIIALIAVWKFPWKKSRSES